MWIPKGAGLIRRRRLLKVRHLLEDIWYLLSNCLFSYCSQQQMNILEGLRTDWISLQISEAAISRCSLEEQCVKRRRKICRNTHSMEVFLKYRWWPRLAAAPLGGSFCDKCNRNVLFKISKTHMTRRANSDGSSFSVSTSFSESVFTQFQGKLLELSGKMYLCNSDGFSKII